MARAKRTYDASDYKELMDNTGGWAKNWGDVLWYLEHVAVYDADFAKNEVPGMIDDVKQLQQDNFPYTTDYRTIWHKLTGADTGELPPPEGVKSHGINPREIAGRWLKGLDFPASKDQVMRRAKDNHAPKHVVQVLSEIDDQTYKNMGLLLEKVGDKTWDHD